MAFEIRNKYVRWFSRGLLSYAVMIIPSTVISGLVLWANKPWANYIAIPLSMFISGIVMSYVCIEWIKNKPNNKA